MIGCRVLELMILVYKKMNHTHSQTRLVVFASRTFLLNLEAYCDLATIYGRVRAWYSSLNLAPHKKRDALEA